MNTVIASPQVPESVGLPLAEMGYVGIAGQLGSRGIGQIGSKRRLHRCAQPTPAQPATPDIICEDDPLPRFDPGTYQARCVGFAGPHWYRRYKRWKIRLDFELIHEPGRVSRFFNMGSTAEAPRAARGSDYREAWILANDGEQPARGDRMSPKIFLDKVFDVRVGDSGRGRKSSAELYSVVHDVLKVVQW